MDTVNKRIITHCNTIIEQCRKDNQQLADNLSEGDSLELSAKLANNVKLTRANEFIAHELITLKAIVRESVHDPIETIIGRLDHYHEMLSDEKRWDKSTINANNIAYAERDKGVKEGTEVLFGSLKSLLKVMEEEGLVEKVEDTNYVYKKV